MNQDARIVPPTDAGMTVADALKALALQPPAARLADAEGYLVERFEQAAAKTTEGEELLVCFVRRVPDPDEEGSTEHDERS